MLFDKSLFLELRGACIRAGSKGAVPLKAIEKKTKGDCFFFLGYLQENDLTSM